MLSSKLRDSLVACIILEVSSFYVEIEGFVAVQRGEDIAWESLFRGDSSIEELLDVKVFGNVDELLKYCNP